MINIENFKDIRGYEGLYLINEYGTVVSLNYMNTRKVKELKKTIKSGYEYVTLTKDGKPFFASVHRLVYSSFNNCDIPEGLEVNHIDENKSNNHYSNLNLMTRYQNNNHGTRTERATAKLKNGKCSKRVYQYDVYGNFIKVWPSTQECARHGIYNVAACCNGERQKSQGYIWSYTPLKKTQNND